MNADPGSLGSVLGQALFCELCRLRLSAYFKYETEQSCLWLPVSTLYVFA